MENQADNMNPIATATQEKVNEVLHNNYDFNIGECLQKAFDLFKQNMGNFILFTLIFGVISIVTTSIPGLGWLAGLFLIPQLAAGYFFVGRSVQQGKITSFNDFFEGFKYVIPLFLLYLVMTILISIGFIIFIIPGIYLAVSYSLTVPFVIFGKMDFWPAMEASRKVVSKQWFLFFGLLLLLGLLNIAGLILLGVGLLFTIPVSSLCLYLVYEKVMGVAEST